MNRELNEHVMIERVEMIARLTTEGTCQEREREIALGLIAELAKGNLMKTKSFSDVYMTNSLEVKNKCNKFVFPDTMATYP